MTFLRCMFFFLLIQTTTFSQNKPTKKQIGDEPYPAPVSYQNLTLEQAALIGHFENKDVGNLHVYASQKQGDDAFLAGSPILPEFSTLFFQKDIADQTFVRGKEPQAVFSVRGEGEELYIIRMPSEKWKHEVALFGWQAGKLVKRQTLATYDCKRKRCTQVDSWLRDVNGDTRLDIIQLKKSTHRRRGKVKLEKQLFLMDQNGLFKKASNTLVDFNNYKMQDLK